MSITKGRKRLLTISVALVGIISILATSTGSVAMAQDQPGYWQYMRTIETQPLGVERPTGLTYLPQANAFAVVQANSSRIRDAVLGRGPGRHAGPGDRAEGPAGPDIRQQRQSFAGI